MFQTGIFMRVDNVSGSIKSRGYRDYAWACIMREGLESANANRQSKGFNTGRIIK